MVRKESALYQPGYSVADREIEAEHRSDGTIILRNAMALPPLQCKLTERLAYWSDTRPEQVYLSQGSRAVSYREAYTLTRRIAGRMLTLPVSAESPLMILGGNGINHALVMLAAVSVGIPAVIVAPTSAQPAAAPWQKLAKMVARVTPGLVVADDIEEASVALEAIGFPGVAVRSLSNLDWTEEIDPVSDAALERAEAQVTPDTVVKLLFTSGSTGTPKAVMNTQRMMVSSMQALGMCWPFLEDRPPIMVDWLPWSHTFGGNHCFNLALWFGGSFHIDEGKPMPGLIDRTIASIRQHRPTVYFNVPAGFEALLPTLENDAEFAREFLGNLDFIFSGGAPMPAAMRARIEAVGLETTGRMPSIFGGWGSTETAPCSTIVNFPTPHAANLGVPLPGSEIKMVPDSGRMELRVRGGNVMPGYWRQPEATAAAFDEEGYYRIGDAGQLADPEDAAAGILFDGRVAENFKLTSGTWVNVGALRLAVIAAGETLLSDAVVAGEGRDEVGLLLFLNNESVCKRMKVSALDQVSPEDIRAHMGELIDRYNSRQLGASTRIGRFLVMEEPPSAIHEEITEKGYINQRRVLARRAALVEQLYAELPN